MPFKPDFQPQKPAKKFFQQNFPFQSRCVIISTKILEVMTMNRPESSKFVPALPNDDETPANENDSDNTNSIKIYDGVAECTMNDSDNLKSIKIKAKNLAQENLLNKIADYVNGFLRDRLLTFPDDEIFAIANEIYNISNINYNVIDSNDNILIRATVIAQIDDTNIMNCLVRFFKERIDLKSQNDSLRKENEDLKRQIAELPAKIVLANQKSNEADELYNKNDYEGAIKLYDEAIELNPYDDDLYEKRGDCYKALGDETKAKADLAKYEKLSK